MRNFICGAILCAGITQASADVVAEKLLTFCNGPKYSLEDTICLFYIAGVYDGLYGGQILAATGSHSCLKNISGTQVRAIVEKYLRDHPERLHEVAAPQIASALWEAFPCK